MRILLPTAKMRSDFGHQLPLMPGTLAADGVGLGVVVEELVGVQIRAVRGQEEKFDPPLLGFDPFLHAFGPMHGMPVDDQEHLAMPCLLEEPTEELEKHPKPELPLENHKAQVSPVGDGRDHVAAKALARPRDNRRLASRCVRPSNLVVGPQPHLVAPIKQGLLRFRSPMKSRVIHIHPPLDSHRIRLVGTPHGFLGCEAPAAQKSPRCRDRQRDPIASPNQLANRLPRSQHKRQLQLIGTAIRDGLDNRPRHLCRQLAAGPRTALRSRPQGLGSTPAMRHHPLAHRLPCDSKRLGRIHLRHPAEHGLDSSLPHLFLCFRIPRPGVFFHANKLQC